MQRWPNVSVWCVVAAALVGGCSGQYVLTLPDQAAPAGGSAAVVVRLRQHEFAGMLRSVEQQAVRFQAADQLERGAFTDALGFAGTTVPVPDKEGLYPLWVSVQDDAGVEAHARAAVYVWNADRPVAAVDLEALPPADAPASLPARKALETLAQTFRLLYLTRTDPYDTAPARAKIRAAAYPDGPVLVWLREFTHLARVGELHLPRIVNEAKLVTGVEFLKGMFPNLSIGITGSSRASEVFRAAGVRPLVPADAENLDGFNRLRTLAKHPLLWSNLAERVASGSVR